MVTSNIKILWLKVWSIAAVQAAITLTWVIYSFYFPLLLVELGLDEKLAIAILIAENVLESVIEPVFGWLSDRQQRLFGSKVPLISLGIVLASLFFIALPCWTIFNFAPALNKWVLPALAIIWAGCMAIFRAPTVSLLSRCATSDRLPQAASILTLVGNFVGAFRFDAYGLILNLGAGFAFTLGSISLIVAAFVLRLINPQEPPRELSPSETIKVSKKLLAAIFIAGIVISWSLRFIMPAVSQILKLHFGAEQGKLTMTIFLIALGLCALPAGKIATKFNISLTMQVGSLSIILILISFLLLPTWRSPLPRIALLTIGFSFILNGIIPLILNLVATAKSGLGVGIYFGGFGAGMSSFDLIIKQLNITTLQFNLLGAIACLSILFCWLKVLQVIGKNQPKPHLS